MAAPGDTAQDTDSGKHLWFVLSDPSPTGTIAIASFMTHRPRVGGHDRTCLIVQPGAHPFIRRETCVAYRHARMITESQFETDLRSGERIQRDPLGPELLRRIQEGALTTPQKIPKRVVAAVVAALGR